MTGPEMTPAGVEDLRVLGDVDGLIRALDPAHPAEVRRAAAVSLGDLVDPRAVGPLIRVLGEKDDQVRLAAVLSLAKIGNPGAVPSPHDPAFRSGRGCQDSNCRGPGHDRGPESGTLPSCRPSRTPTPRSGTRSRGLSGPSRMSRPSGPSSRTLSDPEWHVRMEAEWALLEIGRPAVEPLISALHDEGVRWKVAGVLVKLGSMALEPLRTALQGTADQNMRQGGEWALKKIQELKTRMKERDPFEDRNIPKR